MIGLRGRSRSAGWLFAAPYLVLFIAFLLVPLLYGLRISFYRWELLSLARPRFIGVANYREALGSDDFRNALGFSFRFTVAVVPLMVVLALLVAHGLHAVRGRLQPVYRAAYFLPTLITISVAGLLWRWFYNGEFGLFNALLGHVGLHVPWITDRTWALWSIVVMTLWWAAGVPIVVLLAALQQIPAQYLEAAAIDGANTWQRFVHVRLPLLRPALFFVVVMQVIGSFQVFGQTFIITSGGPELTTRSLVQYIYQTAFNAYRMGYAAAMSWLLFVVIVIFSLLQARLFTATEAGER